MDITEAKRLYLSGLSTHEVAKRAGRFQSSLYRQLKKLGIIRNRGEASRNRLRTKSVLFTCRLCKRTKGLSEFVVMTRFFPPAPACKACAKKYN